MPAKLGLSSTINVTTNTHALVFNNASNGYLDGGMTLNGSGQLVIPTTKLYDVNFYVSIEQNSTPPAANTAVITLFRNGVNVLECSKSYNENDESTFGISAYLKFNAGDVISATIKFSQLVANKIFVLAVPTSTFLNVV